MNILFGLMLLSLLLPIARSFIADSVWERMLCYACVTTRAAVVLILFSRFRHDPMIALVGTVVLSLGNSGLLLLANLLKGVDAE